MTAVAWVLLPLVAAYATTLLWCVDRYNAPTEYFAHCWLVPVVAAVVLWQTRARWRQQPCRTERLGLWLLVPGLLLHVVGAALMIDSWSAASLALTVPGSCWLVFGRSRLRGLWPVVWLVLFAIPAPIYVEGRLAFELKEVAVRGGAIVANVLGADIERLGDRLQPRGGDASLYVAAACGGLRSLLAMLTIAYCLAFFTGPAATARRVFLLVVAAPLAVLANTLRIASLCLLARWFGVPFAEGTGHTLANIVEWLLLLLSLLALDRWIGHRLAPSDSLSTSPSIDHVPLGAAAAPAAARGKASLWPVGLALWLAAAPLLWLSLYRPFGSRDDRAGQLPTAIAGYALQPRTPAEQRAFERNLPQWRELLGTRDFVYRRYRNEQKELVRVVALFHDTNWKSVHPPRICIEGSNMEILADDLIEVGSTPIEASRIVAQDRASSWRFVTLSVFGTASWSSGDYWQFTWHHLPLAVLRRNQSGFLLRVESPIYSGERAADAERRCAEFLAQLLPMARELVQ